MKKQKHRARSAARGLGLVLLAGLVLWGAAACRSGKASPPKPVNILSEDTLKPVFGTAEDTNSGLADFTQSDQEIFLSYHLYLTDRSNADREIALDLAPKIRKLYGYFPNIDRANFEVSLPDPSSPDDWRPYVSFLLTRKIVKESAWSYLFDTDLLAAATEVRRTE